MVFSLTWLPSVLEAAGLKVAEVDGWRTRGRGEMGTVRGTICHHTAGAARGNMPSLDLLIRGRSDLGGPLSQLGLGRDGTYYVIAAGRANHAGGGRWRGIDTGNSSFIGIEAENTGRPDDTWPDVQIDAYQRGVAAILAHIGADAGMCCGHKEYALPPGRKNDPLFEMAPFRAAVQAILSGQTSPPALIPAIDAKSRPTLRRGSEGEVVSLLQEKLGVESNGRFGPGTEAAVREFQRDHRMVPDGIFGPKSWAALDATTATSQSRLARIAPIETTPPVFADAAPRAGASGLPPSDDDKHVVRVQGNKVFTPDGEVFAQVFRGGIFTTGRTSLAKWLASLLSPSPGLSDSAVRVVRAMCVNEGGLEAVNSYDGCFLSAGIFQWTAGADSDPGELALLLSRFKSVSPESYEDCFGRYKLEPQVTRDALIGRLVLDGTALASPAEKEQLRGPEWAYRFWRAGHHPDFRAAQLALAVSRIPRFMQITVMGHQVGQWLTSQYGIALVLDEHVNRPAHVPRTLENALAKLLGEGATANDPSTWSDADELRLLRGYLEIRDTTSMTNSSARARLIGECIRTGQLSDDRGSFQP